MKKQITENTLKTLKAAVRDVGGNLDAYSGRCMFGEHCLGVIAPNPGQLFGAILDNLAHDLRAGDDSVTAQIEELELYFRAARADAMGTETVIYNPSFAVPEGVESCAA